MKSKINNKRGSHVEIVISFLIFMTFVFFIYLITSPALKFEKKDNSLENLASRIAQRASVEVVYSSVSVNSEDNCVQLAGFTGNTGSSNNAIVGRTSSMDSTISGGSLFVEKGNEDFFRVWQSEDFSAGTSLSGCEQLSEGSGYTLGLVKEDSLILESKIQGIIGEYNEDYTSLKNNIGLGPDKEFNMSFTYSNGTTANTRIIRQTPTENINIYSRNFPVIYVSRDADLEIGVLNLRIW